MSLLLRLFRRDLRASAWRTLLFAVTVAIASLTAVGLLATRMHSLMAREANVLLAADAVIVADHEIPDHFASSALAQGLQVAQLVTFPSMARKDDAVTLASIKAASAAYPLRGELKLAPDGNVGAVPKAGEIYTDARLAALLNAQIGDSVQVGMLSLRLAAILEREPDGAIDFTGTQPRLLMNDADLAATELLAFGSRVRYRLLVAGAPQPLENWVAQAKTALDKGERLEDAREARPEISRALDRAERFLRLSALIAAGLSAVAMLLAARRYAARRYDEIAIFRALGASHRQIVRLLFGQLLLLIVLASVLGGLIGWAAEAGLMSAVRDHLPEMIPAPDYRAWLVASGLGSVLLLGGAGPLLWALARTSPLRVLRREMVPGGPVWILWSVLALALGSLFYWLAGNAQLALYSAGGMVGAVLAAGGVGLLLLLLLRQLWPAGTLGLAVRQVLRRKGLAFTQLGALAAGLLGVWLLTIVQHDLVQGWQARLSGDIPNHYAINIQPKQRDQLDALFAARELPAPLAQPMIRGRWVMHNGQPVDSSQFEDGRSRRLAEREFNLSYGDILRDDNRIVAGQPLDETQSGFSVEEGLAERLHIRIGDELEFDVAGTPVRAKVMNLRAVEWDSFRVNFFVTGTRSMLAAQSGSLITSFNLPKSEKALITDIVRTMPNISIIDVGQILDEARRMLDLASAALQLVFFFCIAASVAVLWAALDATESERVREAAVMRALGASASRLRRIWLLESLLLGAVGGLVAGGAASLTGWLIGREVLQIAISFNIWLPLASAALGAAITCASAIKRVAKLAHTSPAILLREET